MSLFAISHRKSSKTLEIAAIHKGPSEIIDFRGTFVYYQHL